MSEQFKSLENLYNHLEDKAQDYDWPHQIGDLFMHIRDKYQKEEKVEESQKAHWELELFNIVIDDYKMIPAFSATSVSLLSICKKSNITY